MELTYFAAWVEHFGLLLTAPLYINYINLSGFQRHVESGDAGQGIG
jgi:hypothetical protein